MMVSVDDYNITHIPDIVPYTSLTPLTYMVLCVYNVVVVVVGIVGNIIVLYSSLRYQA